MLLPRDVFVLGRGREPPRPRLARGAISRWRDGGFCELIPLLGDGLLTIDGEYHRPLAADHAARLPPRADRRRARMMAEEAERRSSTVARRRRSRRLPLDAPAGDARRDARRCSDSTPTLRRDGDRAPSSSARSPSTASDVPARGPARAAHAVARGSRRAAGSTADRSRDRARAAAEAPTGGHAVAAARRPRTRTARAHGRAHVRDETHDAAARAATTRRPRPVESCSTSSRTADVAEVDAAASPAGFRAAAARPGARRDAAPLPAGLDRAAPRGPRRRDRRRAHPRGVRGQLLPRGRSHRLPDVSHEPHAFRPERFAPEARGTAEGRLRAVRGRLADLIGMRFRPARDQGDRGADPGRAPPRRVASPAGR